MTVDGRALLIAPSPRRGLQPEDLDVIEAFIAAGAVDSVDPAGGRAAVVREARRLLGDDGDQ